MRRDYTETIGRLTFVDRNVKTDRYDITFEASKYKYENKIW